MKDFHDRSTHDPFKENLVLFQVNYKYVHDTSKKIRSGQLAIEANNVNDARKVASNELKKEHDHFEVTSIKEWKSA